MKHRENQGKQEHNHVSRKYVQEKPSSSIASISAALYGWPASLAHSMSAAMFDVLWLGRDLDLSFVLSFDFCPAHIWPTAAGRSRAGRRRREAPGRPAGDDVKSPHTADCCPVLLLRHPEPQPAQRHVIDGRARGDQSRPAVCRRRDVSRAVLPCHTRRAVIQTGQPVQSGGHLTLTSQLAACTRQVIEEKAEEFVETFLSMIDECCAAVPGVSACPPPQQQQQQQQQEQRRRRRRRRRREQQQQQRRRRRRQQRSKVSCQ